MGWVGETMRGFCMTSGIIGKQISFCVFMMSEHVSASCPIKTDKIIHVGTFFGRS